MPSKKQQNTKALSTEERILVAAKEVFVKKGYEATRTRDIAEAADINIGSLHYYYRSKEKLFEKVAAATMVKFSHVMDEVLGNSEMPLHTKIRKFVPAYTDFIEENPFIPMFIITESHKNTEKIHKMMNDEKMINVFKKQVEGLVKAKKIRPVTYYNIICDLIGLTVFPFLGKPLFQVKIGINDQEYKDMIDKRKEMVPEMIINHLYYKSPD